MNRLTAGALAGAIATVPMTCTMLLLFRKLPRRQRYPLPPREITERMAQQVNPAAYLGDDQLRRLSLAGHFGYGAATGALYPLLVQSRSQSGRATVARGSSWGLLIWALSYLGWIPAMRILKPATQHPSRRVGLMLLAHLVWGSTTVWISERLAHEADGKVPPHRPVERLVAELG